VVDKSENCSIIFLSPKFFVLSTKNQVSHTEEPIIICQYTPADTRVNITGRIGFEIGIVKNSKQE
jgi:hypothetical protein